MVDFIRGVVLLLTGVATVNLAILALKVFRGDPAEYERNRTRTVSWRNIWRGQVPTAVDGARDYLVASGLAVDRRTNEWIEQGRLSAEAISATLRKRSR
jgi:hypothetical protein